MPVVLHRHLRFAAVMLVTTFCSAIVADEAPQTCELKPALSTTTRAEARIDVAGDLKLLLTLGTEDGGKSRQKTSAVPLSVSAQLRYADRPLEERAAGVIRHSARQYELAQAKIEVGKGEISSSLGDERRTVFIQESANAVNLFAVAGPFDRSELELLSTAADSGLLNHLLPGKKVDVGQSWEPASDVLTRFLRLEVINQSDVSLTLERIEGDIAAISLAGKVAGGVDGVTSDIELSGKLNFNLEQKICTWLALELKEDRGASQGTPGFKTTSRIRVAVSPADVPAELTDAALADLKTVPDASTRLLRFASPTQGFEIVYEPQWRVVSDQPELAVLRYLDRGDLIAQCNMSRLKPLGKGEQLTLEGFQNDLKQSLGKTFVEFVEAGESLSDGGLRVLRVVVSAAVSEVPIHYVFYHLSDDEQNRVSIAFTMDAEMVERFGRAEETLIGSFTFTTPQTPTAITAPASEAKKHAKTTKTK